MDKPCGCSSVRPMITISIATRLIWGMSLDYTDALNASWLCPLLGIILFLPFAFAVNKLCRQLSGYAFNSLFLKNHKPATMVFSLVFSALLLVDASSAVHLLTNTADVMALGETPVWLLALPLALLIFVCGIFGMEAEGRSARIWIRIMLPMLTAVIFVQFRNYRIEWLMPLFGGGAKAIIMGSLYCAGCMALLTLPWLVSVEDTEHSGVFQGALIGSISASVILVLLSMLTPSLINTSLSRSGRIELILSNGRVHLMLQFLMVVLWFSNLLHLMNTESTAAATFLRKALPGASKKLPAAFSAVSVFFLAIFGIGAKKSFSTRCGIFLYPVLCILMLVMLLLDYAQKRRSKHAENP